MKTQPETKHTPTPWHINCAEIMSHDNQFIICDPYAGRANRIQGDRLAMLPIDEREANAAFIVRAVNGFDALITHLKECANELPESSPQRKQALELLSRI